MRHLISRSLINLRTWLKALPIFNSFVVATMAILLVTSNVMPEQNNQALGKAIEERVHQTDQADRPKTTGEWNREARETEGQPEERLKRIGQQSSEAFKQFGSGYVKGAKKTAREIREGVDRTITSPNQ